MRQTKQKRSERLRLIVDTLPYETRVAMLEGLEQYDIIAGAYSDRDGGVCPMLAAHRCGGRTNFRSFARAWDRFTGAKRARRASQRELRTLVAQLERSVWREDQARFAHSKDADRIIDARPATDPEGAQGPRIATKAMGAWLIPFRNLEDYARALHAASAEIGTTRDSVAREAGAGGSQDFRLSPKAIPYIGTTKEHEERQPELVS
jgi:hypothetical protein